MMRKISSGVLIVLAVWLMGASILTAADYYKATPPFHMAPDPEASSYKVKRWGPVGIGLDLRRPNFTMHIVNVEPGSPAEVCGQLKKGQIIESINGQVLKDVDPRILLGNFITDAEAADGVLKLMVKDDVKSQAHEVMVTIPVLGAYSEIWPANCAKADKIVRQFADLLASEKSSIEVGLDAALLFMLSTGEEKDLDIARKWVADLVAKHKDEGEFSTYPWFAGYNGPALCEYYLRTGDESVIPLIEKMADYLKRTIYNGSWMGRGGASYSYMAGGHMNAAGVHCVTFLLMAKECGAEVDEHTLQSSLLHFYRFAGHGNVAYGDGVPEGGMVSNGRNTGLALAMAAAANLTPEGEDSVYAKARDINATKGFYSTSWLFHGHTGGGIGELWRGQSMGLVKEKRPDQYRSFMDGRRWMYELARTHKGDFGWVSDWNVGYADTALEGRGWGSWIPMIYTLPRKQLRMYGAPKSAYAKSYQLPVLPWGTEADAIFYSLAPGEYKPGQRQDIAAERLETDASMPIGERLGAEDVDDDTLLMYACHIDQGIRDSAANAITSHGRTHLIVPLLKSEDPRARLSGLRCITGMFKGDPITDEALTDEMLALVTGMINDPDESWWVVEAALNALGRARPALIAPHVDRLTYWLEHDDWWLRKAAMTALSPVAGDKRFYRKVLPIIGDMVKYNERAVALAPLGDLVKQLQKAEPEVQSFALETLSKAYAEFPTSLAAPGGQDMSAGVDYLLGNVAANMVALPGGYEALFEVGNLRFPEENLPHQDIFMRANPADFGPKVKKAFGSIVMKTLIPQYEQEQAKNLAKELGGRMEGGALSGLVNLYQQAGVSDYDWRTFGTDLAEITWAYYSFDPPEEKYWEVGTRYRAVTYPAGMENWYAVDFDPVKAGWKRGLAPFGQEDGMLRTEPRLWIEQAEDKPIEVRHHFVCKEDYCRCCDPMKTLWEHEVILMRTKIRIPEMQKDHLYRFVLGGQAHMNSGDGYRVYADSKLLFEKERGWGKREGGPMCFYINDEWWPVFEKGEVEIALTSFLRIHKRSGIKGNMISAFMQEMKLPAIELAGDSE